MRALQVAPRPEVLTSPRFRSAAADAVEVVFDAAVGAAVSDPAQQPHLLFGERLWLGHARLIARSAQARALTAAPRRYAILRPVDPAVAESLREQHKPKRVRVLLVGESAPAGETFFYSANSTLYYETRAAFERAVPLREERDGFLESFARLACYLDDLCLEPVNQLPDTERHRKRLASVGPLAARLSKYDPEVVIAIGKTTAAPHVLTALERAGLTNLPFHCVAFPGRPEHKRALHSEMDAILSSIRWIAG